MEDIYCQNYQNSAQQRRKYVTSHISDLSVAADWRGRLHVAGVSNSAGTTAETNVADTRWHLNPV